MKYYSAIGSRKAPEDVLALCRRISASLERLGFCLRSGGAEGCDQAFQSGVVGHALEIYRPEHATPEAISLACKTIPYIAHSRDYIKRLHGRNAQIILGRNLDSPSAFVLAWTPQAALVGGTRMGIMIARNHNIPVFNLADPAQKEFFLSKLALFDRK